MVPRELELVSALEGDAILAHFQPAVDLRSGRVIGVEALARWDHPELGLLPADRFLDLVRESGRMRELTERVLASSARAAGDWWNSGLQLQLSLNLFPEALVEPGWDLPALIAGELSATGLTGEALQFEVTEKALLEQPDAAADSLRRLADLGAAISIDDFGTGHFSLTQLNSLPIDELKIDSSFVSDLDDDEVTAIVRSMIHLAHQMGLRVVAEGVETEDAWRQLRSMGCERAQGFLIAEPLPAREIPAWLVTWNRRVRDLSSTKRARRPRRARRPKPSAAKATA